MNHHHYYIFFFHSYLQLLLLSINEWFLQKFVASHKTFLPNFLLSQKKVLIWDKNRAHQMIRYHFWFTFARKHFHFIMKLIIILENQCRGNSKNYINKFNMYALHDEHFSSSLKNHELNHKKKSSLPFSRTIYNIFGIFMLWRHDGFVCYNLILLFDYFNIHIMTWMSLKLLP